LLAKAAWQSTQLDCVHIPCCGNGHLGFRPDGGSLCKSGKVSKTPLPHHSAPRLGSVCPNTGLNPWAAATRHPWRGAANPASCRGYPRIQACVRPAWFNGAPEIKSRSRSRAARFASWLPSTVTALCRYLWSSQASPPLNFSVLENRVSQQRIDPRSKLPHTSPFLRSP